MTNSRVSRGRESEQAVADFLRRYPRFANARRNPASLSGKDILDVPGIAIEVKARRAFNPKEWAKQAHKNSNGEMPVVVMRPDGMGPATVNEWPTFMTLDWWSSLVDQFDLVSKERDELKRELWKLKGASDIPNSPNPLALWVRGDL